MVDEARYLILDAYPLNTEVRENTVGGAIIGCWIRRDLAVEIADAVALVRDRMKTMWVVSDCLQEEIVDAGTYAESRGDAREMFEQSLIDGFVTHIRTYQREVVHATPSPGAPIRDRGELAGIKHGPWYALIEASQWAYGSTPSGQCYLPLWSASPPSADWQKTWPGHEARGVNVNEITETILPTLARTGDTYFVGVSRENSAMPIFHPTELLDALRA